ncbi:hypothetical protein Taro_011789 [Colocasia esculenta]|uniref:Uncharacterized protein n=1 Tax=Colocasia esculenta TaxID=4460 RepID=A0A843UH53_COLES|nr:hypothetical protein [Colocasia esculenta]
MDEVWSRLVWTTITRSNYKHMLYNVRKRCTESLSESMLDSLEGARTDMDEERLLERSVQHMGRREMARNLHNNESESGCQSRGQQAYKWVCLLCDPSVQIGKSYEKELKQHPTFQEVFDKTHKKKRTDQYIGDRAWEAAESYSQ